MHRPAAVIALGVSLVGLSALLPAPVSADNGTSLQDLWAAFDQAVFAGMATPVLIWAANKVRLPEPDPPYFPPPPPETYSDPVPYARYHSGLGDREPPNTDRSRGGGGDPRR